MTLKELWEACDNAKFFIKVKDGYRPVDDGPGFPVVDMKDASEIPVRNVRVDHWPMYVTVLVINSVKEG